jgi:hypothetical protein
MFKDCINAHNSAGAGLQPAPQRLRIVLMQTNSWNLRKYQFEVRIHWFTNSRRYRVSWYRNRWCGCISTHS